MLNADDFGISSRINAAVRAAFVAGRLSSASILASGKAAEEAAQIAKRDGIPVGVHLALVDAAPVSPAEKIPVLLGEDGKFPKSAIAAGLHHFRKGGWFIVLGPFGAEPQSSPDYLPQLELETAAQIDWFLSRGLKPDHMNSHVNLHIIPAIFAAALTYSVKNGILAMRVPEEPPGWLIRCALKSPGALLIGVALGIFSKMCRALLNDRNRWVETPAGFIEPVLAPEYSFGHAEYPRLGLAALMRYLNKTKLSFVEIALHLDQDGQLEQLLSDEFGELIRAGGWRLSRMGEILK